MIYNVTVWLQNYQFNKYYVRYGKQIVYKYEYYLRTRNIHLYTFSTHSIHLKKNDAQYIHIWTKIDLARKDFGRDVHDSIE